MNILWYKLSIIWYKISLYKYKCLVFSYKSLDSTDWAAKGTQTGVIVQNEKNSTKRAH